MKKALLKLLLCTLFGAVCLLLLHYKTQANENQNQVMPNDTRIIDSIVISNDISP